MYLRRRIDKYLLSWKRDKRRLPLLVRGIKECGKTRSVREFAKKNYNHVFYIDFVKNPEARKDFLCEELSETIDKLSIRFPKEQFVENETIFIFDNIAYFKEGFNVMKKIQATKHYDVIAISERIDVCNFKDKGITVYDMKSMDFVEFLYALSFDKKQLDIVYDALENKTNIPFTLHQSIKKALYQYALIGGFPSTVDSFLEFRKWEDAFRENQRIYFEIETDFGKRLEEDNRRSFSPSEVDIIRQIIKLIPGFLKKDNKRFYIRELSTGTPEDKMKAFKYLEDVGLVTLNYNILKLPISERIKLDDRFKVFFNDIFFFTMNLNQKKKNSVLKGNLLLEKGDLIESIVHDALYKVGKKEYHQYNDDGEVDFVIKGDNSTILIESKGRTLKYHKTLIEEHRIIEEYKIDDTNIIAGNKLMSMPLYLLYFMGERME